MGTKEKSRQEVHVTGEGRAGKSGIPKVKFEGDKLLLITTFTVNKTLWTSTISHYGRVMKGM